MGVAAVVGGVLAALVVARHDALAVSITRAAALSAGVVTVGLCFLPWLLRAERAGRGAAREYRRWRMVAVSAAIWCATTLAAAAASAASLAGAAATSLPLHDFQAYLMQVQAGRMSLITVGCAGLIATAAVVLSRAPSASTTHWNFSVGAVALTGLVAPPLAGHASHNDFALVLIAAHAVAAALWCGLLVGQALLLRSRTEWAIALPAFSRLAAVLVATVGFSGIGTALLILDNPADLLATGYGRIVLTKAALLAILLGLAWWWRRSWVGAVQRHRADVDTSIRRAALEVAVMAIAFGLAATLALTS